MCIRKILKMKKPSVLGVCLKHTGFLLMIVSWSFKVYVNLEKKSRNLYFHLLAMIICLHQKISYLLVKRLFLLLKQVDTYEYNPRCLM